MEAWKTRARETVFEAAPFVSVSKETVELPDGRLIEDFYQVDLRSFALVVPVMENGEILMLRQYKHGPRRVSVTFPAGFIDPGEAPDVAARRELMEETGVEAQSLEPMGRFVDNGNQRGCEGHYFLAHGCRRVAEPNAGDLEDMQEEFWTAEDLDHAMMVGDLAVIHHVAAWGMARLRL
ncbi:NUDIX hydrolase [Shimia sp. MMG029]|uniref:NUDIX hydrolase n=1 Tax=Shimia sp. MMG029 TaxID=3021978 RepID=UPI0022FF3216|nr:NUDIX hydrolase [Shimia sp. MMG029]MDA5555884.1 NUDIX hydrolase [Shimia sp. MMG029]